MNTSSESTGANSLARYIDHTLLRPEATKVEIRKLCEEALLNRFFAVCVNPFHISCAREVLRSSKVQICTVIGFPLGANDENTKAFEAARAVNTGANEIDMVLNIGALKSREFTFLEREIAAVVRASEGRIVKVIIETGLLEKEEKIKACEISLKAGASFVKTCTGFNKGAATVEDVLLMKSVVGTKIQIKASGGISSVTLAQELITAGATRLGTSHGVSLVKGLDASSGDY